MSQEVESKTVAITIPAGLLGFCATKARHTCRIFFTFTALQQPGLRIVLVLRTGLTRLAIALIQLTSNPAMNASRTHSLQQDVGEKLSEALYEMPRICFWK